MPSFSPLKYIGINSQITYAPADDASVTPTNSATSSDGLASSTLRLGSLPGDYTVNATCSECTEGSPQTFTATAKCPDVPQYYQDDYSDDYDGICKDYENLTSSGKPGVKTCALGDKTWTIAEKGCALASMGMVMERYKYPTPNTPDKLNDIFIKDIAGYDKKGSVKWYAPNVITGYGIQYQYDPTHFGKGETLPKSLMDNYLGKCMPVIVRVINPHTHNPQHWIVVTGKVDNDYTVNDSDLANKDLKWLSKYGDIYDIRVYKDPKGGCQ